MKSGGDGVSLAVRGLHHLHFVFHYRSDFFAAEIRGSQSVRPAEGRGRGSELSRNRASWLLVARGALELLQWSLEP